VVVVVGFAVSAVAVAGFARLSVTTTLGFVLVVVVVVFVSWALARAYENNTKPRNIIRLESRLIVIVYLFFVGMTGGPRPAVSMLTHKMCQVESIG